MMQKFHIMPFILNISRSPLTLPRGEPPESLPVRGVIRWSITDWSEEDYALIEKEVNTVLSACSGKEIYEVVEHVANMLSKKLPDQNFIVSMGSFGIERKIKNETKSEEGS